MRTFFSPFGAVHEVRKRLLLLEVKKKKGNHFLCLLLPQVVSWDIGKFSCVCVLYYHVSLSLSLCDL